MIVESKVFAAAMNNLAGPIGSFISPELLAIHINDNLLTGTLPTLDASVQLKTVLCASNSLEGTVPVMVHRSSLSLALAFLDISGRALQTESLRGGLGRAREIERQERKRGRGGRWQDRGEAQEELAVGVDWQLGLR